MEDSHRSARNDNGSADTYERLKQMLAECLAATNVTTFEEREAAVMRITNAAARDVLTDDLQRRSDELADELRIDGILHRRHQPGVVLIHSLCGSFALRRWTYRPVGVRNAATRVPVELEAGIIERTTPALAYGVMAGYAKWHMRDHERMLLAAHRCPPSRSTLERAAKALGQRTKESTCTIEPVLRKSEVSV